MIRFVALLLALFLNQNILGSEKKLDIDFTKLLLERQKERAKNKKCFEYKGELSSDLMRTEDYCEAIPSDCKVKPKRGKIAYCKSSTKGACYKDGNWQTESAIFNIPADIKYNYSYRSTNTINQNNIHTLCVHPIK